MGSALKLFNSVLFVFFLVHALAPPLIGAQLLLPQTLFPDILIHFKNQYITHSGDYLMAEPPPFFIGLLWLELLLQWPLTLLNLYAISTAKSWLHTTCLIYGVSLFSAMAAIAAELIGSQRASGILLTIYSPFLVLGVFAMLRGLLPHCRKATTTGHGAGPSIATKKKA
ncbi:transmembrane protein 97-like [Cucumis melo var. makuwa]|uniref:Transmembrane protein 97-like n=2 Tax=Cucumis melo TaxID=3656 RepID=A0A5D3CY30_CUCMM|nr:transmembrane protein 97-like [Cucumis melo var. makuwa]TYK16707.1 transmembrane protein 97-like [Cucumis melo var. makuwa]